jgi:hypothetical protein
MADWLFTWKGIVPGAVMLVGAVTLGIAFRGGTLGNVASIVGLAVSVLGFVVTIWTVLDARQQIKDAADRSEKAIAQAREEVGRAVGGIASQLLAADCAVLRTGVQDLRQAAQDMKWPRAVYRCQECRTVAYRLAHDSRLTGEETSKLREAADDFQLIQRFIEKNRLAGQAGLLQDRHIQSLDDVIGLLARIQARFHHGSLRPTEESSESQ